MRKTIAFNKIMSFVLAMVMMIVMIPAQFFPQAADDATNENGYDVDGFKGASPTMLVYPNRETTVTLSLPSAEYKAAYDIVFVMDSSSSTQNSSIDFSEIALELLDGVKDKNVNLKVGVIKCRGRAFDTVNLVTDGAQKELVEYSEDTKEAITDAINFTEEDLKALSSGTNMHGGLKLADKWLTADTDVSNDHKFVFFLIDGKMYIWNDEEGEPTSVYGQYMAKNVVYSKPAVGQQTIAYSKSAYKFTDNQGYYNKEGATDLVDLTFDEYFAKTHNFYHNDFAKLYASSNAELSGVTKYDCYCWYADKGPAAATGTVNEHTVSNGNFTYNLHKKYYEFIPSEDFAGLNWLQANPYTVEVDDNGTSDDASDDVYTYTTTPNPDFYQLHPDGLQKALYLTGHLWTDMVAKYNGASIVYNGWGSGSGLEIAKSFNNWILSDGISDYAAEFDKTNADEVSTVFEAVKDDILYMVSRGVVTDIIGDDFSLLNTDSADCFKMTFDGEALPVIFSNGVWSFGAANEGTYPYVVEYDATTKTITWIINVPVENARPITLSYDLTLPEDAESGYYDTNMSAVLDYKSTDGKKDGTYVFDVPQVIYICPGNNPPANFDVDGSKTASPTLLVCPDRQTTVTLSLPSKEYKAAYDIVFVMDSSSSTQNSSIDFSEIALELLDGVKDKNVNLKVGVIKCRGRAFDTVNLVTDGAQKELVEYSEDTKEAITDAINFTEEDLKALSSGTNMHGGLKLADKWLTADTDVSNDHKFVFFLIDGKMYIWNDEEGEPTSVYGQYMAKNVVYSKPAVGQQTIAYSKSAYKFTDNQGYYNKEGATDLVDLTFDEYFAKTHNFYHNDFAKLYASSNAELSGVTKYDCYCWYADKGPAAATGTVNEHTVSNGNFTYNLHKKYYEFIPSEDFAGLNWLQANPYTVEVDDNGTSDDASDDVYTYTTTPNPDFYQLHPDGLQKALYLTGHLWTDMVAKYNGASIVYNGWGSGSGLEIAKSFNNWILSDGISDYAAEFDKTNADEVSTVFEAVKDDILYMVSRGVVADKIGDDFSLANTDSENCFRMTLSGADLQVTFANGIWSFGTPDAEGIYPYEVAYDSANKTILWTINVPVENAHPITLSYDLTLRSDAPTGFYDTNEWAILNYKSSDGKKDGTYVFEIPEINFICPGNNPPSEFDVDGSKVASPTELACPNRQTTVTLSLPSAEYKPAYDVVFVMDSSTSTQNSNIDFSEIVLELLDGAKEKNIDLKVGVIKTRGIAFDIISLVTEGEHEKLVEYSDDTKEAIIYSINVPGWALFLYSHSSGTNMHGALKMADEWLTADTTVSNDHKFVFFLTDGKTYIWNNENNEPTSVYGQYMSRGEVHATPEVGQQTIAYSKSAYKFTDRLGYYNKAEAGDLENLTFDEYFAKTHNFYTNDFAKLYASTNTELSEATKYDYFCRYAANNGNEAADGTVVEHEVSNGNGFSYNLHKKYYEFIPADNFSDLNWLQANPYVVVKDGDVYSYDTTTPNPDFYQLHPDGLQKALYLTGHLWTDMVAKYNGVAIVYSGWGGGSGLEIAQSFNNWIKSDGISDYSADFVDPDSILSIFDSIKDDILYMIASGVVADVIGDDFSLLNTDKATCFRMTLNGTDLQVTFENDVWSFGTPDEEGKYPYEVKYDDDRKMIIWTINVPVEIVKPVTLSYDLELREDAETDFYDTNEWAILNYKSSDGTHDGSYVFDVPVVSYIACIEVNVEKIWDDSNNRYNTRPDSVTVVLTDGEGHEWTLELNESGEWKGTFGHVSNMHIPDSKLVEVEDENGEVVGSFVPITYSLKELEVYGYECEITGDTDVGFTITNTRLTPDLTITKTVTDEADCARVFLFKVTGVNDFEQIICIVGNGSVTLKDMLFGKYNVTELTDWSYDYDIVGDASREADLTTGDKTVTFANKADDTNWLRAEAYADNWVSPNPVQ